METQRPDVGPPRPSLAKYFVAQLSSRQPEAPQAVKHERVYNFLSVPQKLEQVAHPAVAPHLSPP